jgi:hypothetical protein
MQYIAEVSGHSGQTTAGVENVKRIILETNPLLEGKWRVALWYQRRSPNFTLAFGNAKTLRNNNSSRFVSMVGCTAFNLHAFRVNILRSNLIKMASQMAVKLPITFLKRYGYSQVYTVRY